MIQLAERLTEVARQKAEEELILAQRALQRADDDEIDDDDDDDVQHGEDIEYVMFEWLYSYIIELQSHCWVKHELYKYWPNSVVACQNLFLLTRAFVG